MSSRPRDVWLIDFGLSDEEEAKRFPLLYDRIRDRVKPERQANARESYRRLWWRFLEPRHELRDALAGLNRYIATLEVSKHRFFTFMDSSVAPDGSLVCVAAADPFHLGVLQSAVHVAWTLAAGGTLEDRPRYNKSLCFDPFPFPDPPAALRARIGTTAERLDEHRKAALARSEHVTMTGMYNVVEKLRLGTALTKKEQEVHTLAACGVLRDLHDELDALTAQAYGWEWPLPSDIILERLVALHDERVGEEKAGKVRWLRPDYQIARFGKGLEAPAPGLGLPEAERAAKAVPKPKWPGTVIEQIAAIKQTLHLEALSTEEIASRFTGARADMIRRHLDTLDVMGEVRRDLDGRYLNAEVGVAAAPRL